MERCLAALMQYEKYGIQNSLITRNALNVEKCNIEFTLLFNMITIMIYDTPYLLISRFTVLLIFVEIGHFGQKPLFGLFNIGRGSSDGNHIVLIARGRNHDVHPVVVHHVANGFPLAADNVTMKFEWHLVARSDGSIRI